MKYRVSHVEAFRAWEADEEAETDDLIARILGKDEPSERMLAGTALHRALELADHGVEADTLTANGYTFHFAEDFDLALPDVRELRAARTWMVDGEPITISGQVDCIDGKRIEDHKTTGRFDPDRYLSGCQWRLYLSIFGADRFRWNVFEIAERKPLVYDVRAQHTLEQWRYPALEDDCTRLVERFARFVRERVQIAA